MVENNSKIIRTRLRGGTNIRIIQNPEKPASFNLLIDALINDKKYTMDIKTTKTFKIKINKLLYVKLYTFFNTSVNKESNVKVNK